MKKTVSIIGAGPSALLLAAFLDTDLFDITIYEKNKSVGRKFLVAGKGGFNLSHSEDINTLVQRYTPVSFLEEALRGFDNQDLMRWLDEIGIPTFTGSSKRIFPVKGIKPIEVLNAILAVLEQKKVRIAKEHTWTGWTANDDLEFNSTTIVQSDYCVFALGGASWKVTGSDGKWLYTFEKRGIKTTPFRSANCAFEIEWPKEFIHKNEGLPLKNIAISCQSKKQKGEVVVTRFGLEGNAIYALSSGIQNELSSKNEASIFIDLKPGLSIEKVLNKLSASGSKNTTEALRKVLKLSKTQLDLLKSFTTKEEFSNLEILSTRVKNLPLSVKSAATIDQAISTIGGLDLSSVNSNFELHKLKGNFCIGEMLDWNAPTGGYLLQACFSMGVHLARFLNRKKTIP